MATKESESKRDDISLPCMMYQPCLLYYDQKIYILGSNNDSRSWCYDCKTQKCKQIQPLPVTPKGRSYSFMMKDGKIVVVGAKLQMYPYQSSFCVSYNVQNGNWIKHSLGIKFGAGFAAIKLNDFLIISGGLNKQRNALVHNDENHRSYNEKLYLLQFNSKLEVKVIV